MADYEFADAAEWDENAVPISDAELASALSAPKSGVKQKPHQQAHPNLPHRARPILFPKPASPPKLPHSPHPTHSTKSASPQRLPHSSYLTHSTKSASPERRRPRWAPNLVTDPDNDGRVAWRSKRRPDAVYPLPPGFQGGRVKLGKLDFISKKTGTHIAASDSPGDTMLQIWGNPDQVKAAIAGIEAWITENYGRKKQGMWAHIPSLSEEMKKRQEIKLQREAMRQAFRQSPSETTTFRASGFYYWPKDDDRSAESIFGRSLEAFDEIRMEFSCYIVYDKARSALKVLGDDIQQVRQAVDKVRATYYQLVSTSIAEDAEQQKATILPLARKLIDPDAEVLLIPYGREAPDPSNSAPAGVFPRLLAPGEAEVSCSAELLKEVWHANLENLKAAIIGSLRRLSYYHGNARMRVRFGTLLLTKYKASKTGEYTLEDLESVFQEAQTATRVTEEIGDKQIENGLLQRFFSASHMLFPADTMTKRLHEVKPAFSATLTMLPANAEDPVQVEIEAGADPMSFKWTKLNNNATELSKLVNVSLTNLENGSAWHFEVQGGPNVDKARFPTLRRLIELVKFDIAVAEDYYGGDRFIKVPSSVRLLSVQQKTAWRYVLKDCSYICEVAKIQTFSATESKDNVIGAARLVGQEPRWAVSVFDNAWDTSLSQHAKLSTGSKAAWRAEPEFFFPKEAFFGIKEPVTDGTDAFLQKLEEVERLVRGNAS